jgi:hypothetical protein
MGRSISRILPVLAATILSVSSGQAMADESNTPGKRSLRPSLTAEERTLHEIQEEGRARVQEVAAKLSGAASEAERRMLQDRIIELKTEYRQRFLHAREGFTRTPEELAPAFATAGWLCNPDDNTPVCTANGHQTLGGTISDGAGGAFLVWADFRNGSHYDIYAHHLQASGELDPSWPANGLAVCTASGDQTYSTVLSDGSGGIIVAWHDGRGANDDIYAQHVFGWGFVDPTWPANGRAVCTAAGDQWYAKLISDDAGGAILTWLDYRSGNADIYAHHLLASGAVDPAWPVNGVALTTATGWQQGALCVSDGAGGAISFWTDFRYGDRDVFAQHVLASGVVDPTWPTNGLAVCSYAWDQTYAWPVSDGAGGAFVTWEDTRYGDYDVYAHHILASGAKDPSWPWNGFPVCSKSDDQRYPVPLSDGTAGFFVGWEDSVGSEVDAYAQRVLANGTLDPSWPANGLPVSTATGDQLDLVLISDDAGGVLLAWDDIRGSELDIYAHHVLPSGAVDPVWPVNGQALTTASGSQAWPSLVRDYDGGLVAAWKDWRNGESNIDIYAAHLNNKGRNDDVLEDNDLCAFATPLESGGYGNLHVYVDDWDWYEMTMQRGSKLIVDLLFSHDSGDIDMVLYDYCSGSVLAASQSVTDNEHIEYTNLGPSMDVVLQVYVLVLEPCNTYAMEVSVQGTSNLNATVTPSGWAAPIVPRNTGDAGESAAALPPVLNGNAGDTYFNWVTLHEGPNYLPGWWTELWLDLETLIGAYSVPDNNGPDLYMWLNNGPHTVRGGRHTLAHAADASGQVLETNEADNSLNGQWVWSPLTVSSNAPVERPKPPLTGFGPEPNSDGLRFRRHQDHAWVTGIAPHHPADDYDLLLYDDYSGSTSGFSNMVGNSTLGGNAVDFVVGSFFETPLVVYPGVVRFSGGAEANYSADQTTSEERMGGGMASFPGQEMGPHRFLDLYEAELAAGTTYGIGLHRVSSSPDLAFTVFPATPGGLWSPMSPDATPSAQVDADTDTLTFTAPASGRYPIVVHRTVGSGLPELGVIYNFAWGPSGTVDVPREEPRSFALAFHGAWPNPVLNSTQLRFDLAERGPVRLAVFDLRGRLISTLVDAVLEAGPHAVVWNGRAEGGSRLNSGVYWTRLEAGDQSFTKRIVLLE